MPYQLDKPPEPDEWEAASLRLTAFPGMVDNVPAEAWWEETVGQPADKVTRQRLGSIDVVGSASSGQLVLNVDPVRSEWRLLPAEEGLSITGEIVTLGSFSQIGESFFSLMSRWLSSHPYEITRLAFGAELLLPVKDHASGYGRLALYLSPNVTVDPEISSDLLYQINRPRESQVDIPDLRINRLMKWSVGRLGRLVVLPNGQVVQLPGVERYFCHLVVDINTVDEFAGPLPSDKLPVIFRELVDLGREIAAKGAIP
jgi:hypothetical protein